ncbi:MAG TPA: carboxypeptidase regulatory-like domain-containing protein, partial [Gemmatimonadaceae bacterium]|nr:carboxypeptidase regulatory-like domain-containing protein [Gemmatimonadaceae bacterium]
MSRVARRRRNRVAAIALGAMALGVFSSVSRAQISRGADSTPRGAVEASIVSAATSEPLAGASIRVVGTTIGALADTVGRVVLAHLDTGTIDVEARAFGFASVTQRVIVRPGETTQVAFRLAVAAASLNAMRIEARATDRATFVDKPNVGLVSL